MATVVTGQVGPVVAVAAGVQQFPIRQGRNAEIIVSELHGKYYEQSRVGNLYTAAQATAGVLMTIGTATTTAAALANPTGSGKGLSLIRVEMAIAVLPGTPVVGYYGIFVNVTANATLVTGTALTVIPGLVGGAGAAVGKPFTTATLPVAPVLARVLANKETGLATTTTYLPTLFLDFDGTMVLTPGTYASVGQINADTSNATAVTVFVWEEVDL